MFLGGVKASFTSCGEKLTIIFINAFPRTSRQSPVLLKCHDPRIFRQPVNNGQWVVSFREASISSVIFVTWVWWKGWGNVKEALPFFLLFESADLRSLISHQKKTTVEMYRCLSRLTDLPEFSNKSTMFVQTNNSSKGRTIFCLEYKVLLAKNKLDDRIWNCPRFFIFLVLQSHTDGLRNDVLLEISYLPRGLKFRAALNGEKLWYDKITVWSWAQSRPSIYNLYSF